VGGQFALPSVTPNSGRLILAVPVIYAHALLCLCCLPLTDPLGRKPRRTQESLAMEVNSMLCMVGLVFLDFSILVRFSSVLFFFGFGIRTPPQCKSILVCENSKIESMYFDGQFLLKYINRTHWVWRSYSSHLVWSTPLHSAWSVRLSVTAVSPSITAQPINMPFGLRTWVAAVIVLLFSVLVFAHHCNAGVS